VNWLETISLAVISFAVGWIVAAGIRHWMKKVQ